MSSRTDLNEAALNISKLLSVLTGMDDRQVEILLVNHRVAERLKDETSNMLKYALYVIEEGQHLP